MVILHISLCLQFQVLGLPLKPGLIKIGSRSNFASYFLSLCWKDGDGQRMRGGVLVIALSFLLAGLVYFAHDGSVHVD